MDSNDILYIIIWVLSILLIIHYSHKIITFVTENFESKTIEDEYTNETTNAPVISTTAPVTTPNPNVFSEEPNICAVDDCPLASVLSNYPNIGEKWGDHPGECVKVVNSENAKCARCPPGTYVDYTNVEGVCTKCPAGQYSTKYNSLSCKPCADGSEEGQNYCLSETNNVDNLLIPTKENDKLLSNLYENNIRKYQQFQTLNSRLNRLNNIVDSLDSF